MNVINLCTRIGLSGAGILLAFTVSAQTPVKTVVDNQRMVTFPTCDSLTKDQVAAQVKYDFVQNRYTRWQDDKALLGSKPVAWVNTAEVTEKDGNYSVPLTVRGSKKELSYIVDINCAAQTMTYGLPK
ncbi:MAG TPA: small secreted protein YebF [Morganella sp. (in: Bacteria)]|nr:small secreted protein YebF [Morganella sp. (in: enterobacteria)]